MAQNPCFVCKGTKVLECDGVKATCSTCRVQSDEGKTCKTCDDSHYVCFFVANDGSIAPCKVPADMNNPNGGVHRVEPCPDCPKSDEGKCETCQGEGFIYGPDVNGVGDNISDIHSNKHVCPDCPKSDEGSQSYKTCKICDKPICTFHSPPKMEHEADAHHWDYFCHGECKPSASEPYPEPTDVMTKFENLLARWQDNGVELAECNDLRIAFALGQVYVTESGCKECSPCHHQKKSLCKDDLPHHCSNCDNDV